MSVKPIPDGYNIITPILLAPDADRLLEFTKRAFGAREHQIARRPDGRIWHADVTIDGAHLMISEAPPAQGASAMAINLYVADTDATYTRACAAGAEPVTPPSDRFYGDRNAVVKDPTGVVWSLTTHIEDVPPEELKRREAEAIQQLARGGDPHA